MKIKLGSKRMVIKGNKIVSYAGLVVFFFILLFIFGDRKGPEIQGAKDIFMSVGESIPYKEGISISDNRPGDVSLSFDESKVNKNVPGTYEGYYILKDKAHNETFKKVNVIVQPQDRKPPNIFGVRTVIVKKGEKPDLRYGVYALDKNDVYPSLKVDTSKVDFNKTGKYKVKYIAEDHSKNISQKTATAYVKDGMDDALATNENIKREAGAVNSEILSSKMSQEEKMRKIFEWVHKIEATETKKILAPEAIYQGLTSSKVIEKYRSDLARALLLDAGVPSVKVTTNSQFRDHSWLLVCVNQGWFHFDAKPHQQGKEIFAFMLSDGKVKQYSKTQIPEYYSYDKKKYPPVSKKAYRFKKK